MIEIIAFDGDDTLWHEAPLFQSSIMKFKGILAGYHENDRVHDILSDKSKKIGPATIKIKNK